MCLQVGSDGVSTGDNAEAEIDAVAGLVADGTITASTRVWAAGLKGWMTFAEAAGPLGLADTLAAAAPLVAAAAIVADFTSATEDYDVAKALYTVAANGLAAVLGPVGLSANRCATKEKRCRPMQVVD